MKKGIKKVEGGMMFKKILSFSLIFIFVLSILALSIAQEIVENMVKGAVETIAEDGSYIIVGGTKILTTPEFLEDTYLELGDNVEITAEKTEEGLKALECTYTVEELQPSDLNEEVLEEKVEEKVAPEKSFP